MAYLGNSPFQLSQLPSAAIPFTGSQFAVNLVPNTVSALDLGSPSNPWRNVYGNVVGSVTNVAGGAANRIPYQTAANTTSFVAAPTVTDTYLKWNSSTGFSWSAVSSGSSLTGLTQDTVYSGGPYGNTILGYSAYASGNNNNTRFNVVVGVNAYSTWYESVALGYNSKAEGAQVLSIGVSARTRSDQSMAIGSNASIGLSAGQSVAIGNSAAVSDYTGESTTIGYNAKSYATGGTAIGHYSEARGNYSIGIGKSAYASGSNSAAIGYSAYAYASNSIVIGSSASDNYNSAIVLNATSNALSANSNGFYVKPINPGTTSDVLYYDASTGQITYGTGGGGSSALAVKYNGSTVVGQPISINFTGAGVTVTNNGPEINVTIAGGSSGGGSGAPAQLSGNGFSLVDFSPYGYSFSLDSNATATAFNNAYNNLISPLTTFSTNTNIYSMMILTAVYGNTYFSLGPEWSPTLMAPTLSQNGPTSFSIQTSQSFYQNSISSFPQYSDNTNKIWFIVSLGQLQYNSLTHNAQYSGPTSARVFPNSYMGPGGQDPLPSVLTLLTTLSTIDSGVHSVVIRAAGYNAINGQNSMLAFFGCTNITYENGALSFSYLTSADYGNYPGSMIAFGIDIQ